MLRRCLSFCIIGVLVFLCACSGNSAGDTQVSSADAILAHMESKYDMEFTFVGDWEELDSGGYSVSLSCPSFDEPVFCKSENGVYSDNFMAHMYYDEMISLLQDALHILASDGAVFYEVANEVTGDLSLDSTFEDYLAGSGEIVADFEIPYSVWDYHMVDIFQQFLNDHFGVYSVRLAVVYNDDYPISDRAALIDKVDTDGVVEYVELSRINAELSGEIFWRK